MQQMGILSGKKKKYAISLLVFPALIPCLVIILSRRRPCLTETPTRGSVAAQETAQTGLRSVPSGVTARSTAMDRPMPLPVREVAAARAILQPRMVEAVNLKRLHAVGNVAEEKRVQTAGKRLEVPPDQHLILYQEGLQ